MAVRLKAPPLEGQRAPGSPTGFLGLFTTCHVNTRGDRHRSSERALRKRAAPDRRSVTLATASPLHYQMALALFSVSQAVARNQPVAPVAACFTRDRGRRRLLCRTVPVGWYVTHCRIRSARTPGSLQPVHPVTFKTRAVQAGEDPSPRRVT